MKYWLRNCGHVTRDGYIFFPFPHIVYFQRSYLHQPMFLSTGFTTCLQMMDGAINGVWVGLCSTLSRVYPVKYARGFVLPYIAVGRVVILGIFMSPMIAMLLRWYWGIVKYLLHIFPDNKVHVAHMGPIWGRQDPGGPHVGPMNFAIWAVYYRFQQTQNIINKLLLCPNDILT